MRLLVAECVGTFLLVLFGNGAVANVLLRDSKGNQGGWITISAGWGLAVAIAVYACGWISNAHINPAVTFSFAVIGQISWSEVPLYFVGQFIGGFLGALVVYLTYYTHYQREQTVSLRKMTFCTEPAIRKLWWNFLTEVVATFALLFSLLGVLNTHNAIVSGLTPALVGLIVFAIGLSLGGPTGYAINPARDISPRLAYSLLYSFREADWSYAWVPLVGPLVGGVLGALTYQYLFSFI